MFIFSLMQSRTLGMQLFGSMWSDLTKNDSNEMCPNIDTLCVLITVV